MNPMVTTPQSMAFRRAALPTRAHRAIIGLLAVMAIASSMLFLRLGEPKAFWDESYYIPAAARYELGYASLAAHPPLGLMLIAAGDRLSGANRGVPLEAIAPYKKIPGARLPATFSYIGMRWMAAAFGVLASALLFLLMLELIGQPMAAFVATTPFLFDTALLTQMRAAQLDAFQICFAVAALLCLAKGDRRPGPLWLFGFGLACGLAAMVRANGVLLLAGGLLPCWRAWAEGTSEAWRSRLAGMVRAGGTIAAGAVIAAMAVFTAHLLVAPRAMPPSWRQAQLTASFVTEPYRAYTEGRAPLSPRVAMAAADDYRRYMGADVARIGFTDGNGSSPWVWLLGRHPINYRWDSDGQQTAFVSLVPNMAAWLLSLIGVGAGIVAALRVARGQTGALAPRDRPVLLVLLALWAVLFGSNVVLAQLRTMYLYHYFLPLLVGWVLATFLWARARGEAAGVGRMPTVALACVLACFTLAAPLVLHGPISERECRIRTVLNGPALCADAWKVVRKGPALPKLP